MKNPTLCVIWMPSIANVFQCSTLALLFAVHYTANAQTQTSEPVLPEVVVTGTHLESDLSLDKPTETGSRLGLTLRETPASVEVVSGDEIRLRGDSSVYGAVTRFTGITGSGTPGNGGTALSSRGFTGHGSVMYLNDGVRMATGAGTVTFPFDTWTLGSIEALRGPASVLYGESSIGGAINVTPKRPTSTQAPIDVYTSAGSYNSYALGLGTGGPLAERLSYRIDAIGRRSNGYVDRGDSKSAALSAALKYDIDPSLSVTLQYDGGRQHPMRYFGTPLVNGTIRPDTVSLNYNVRDSEIRYNDDWTRLKAEWQPVGNVKVRNELYYLNADRHWRNLETYAYNPAANNVNRSDYLEIFHDQSQIGNRLDATIDGKLLGLDNRVTAGLEANRIKFRHTNNFAFSGSSTVPVTGFDPGDFQGGSATAPKFQTTTNQTAVFFEDRLSLDASKHLVAGLRHDRIAFERQNLVPASGFSKDLTATTGRLGAVWDLNKESTVYAQWSRGTDPIGSIITLNASNSQFELSTGTQFEVGLKQAFMQGKGEWTLAGYQIDKNKLLTRDPNNPTRVQQIGAQSSRGVEGSLAIRPLAGLSVMANVALLRARFDDFTENNNGVPVSRNGNVPRNVPQRSANLLATYNFSSAWNIGGALRYVGKRYSNSANTITLPAYTVLDASIGYRVTKTSAITLRIFNLADRVYADAPYNNGQWILGAPRSIELSANLSF
jgi:iron complex outermembrane receptor protein